ncbi:MAG TPA: thiamine pyrophosphate-dependent enzyme, partial [Solirubrobacteraceae bacterium]
MATTESITNRAFRLRRRPVGEPGMSDLELVEEQLPPLEDGEALVRTLYLSLDPTNRLWMSDMRQYSEPVELGAVMRGIGIAEVVESRRDDMRVGSLVSGYTNWQEYCVAGADMGFNPLPDPLPAPLTTFLGPLGHTGMTAYVGLEFVKPQPGETGVISAAGGAVGSIAGLRSSDAVNGSHRGHHQFLAKALTHVTKGALSLDSLVTPEVAEVLQRTLAEILGLAQGYCAGRGGSMHLQWFEAGALGTNAIVGGGVPMATGNAWAQKHAAALSGAGGPDGSDLTVTYFGDGAVNIGSVLESLNLASAWRLPVCFFVENNGYAVSTTVEEATGEPRLSARALGFGIPAWRVDGMDPLAVHLVMRKAADRLRSGQGPVVVEALVYRYFHQNGSYPGSAFGYRTREEEAEWRARDPLDLMAREMTRLGLVDEAGVAAVRAQAVDAMRAAAAALVEPDPAQGAKAGARRIRPELWPDPAFVNVGVRGDLSELAGARTLERPEFTGQLRRGRFIDAVSAVMDRRMGEDPRIVVFGEDVHKL